MQCPFLRHSHGILLKDTVVPYVLGHHIWSTQLLGTLPFEHVSFVVVRPVLAPWHLDPLKGPCWRSDSTLDRWRWHPRHQASCPMKRHSAGDVPEGVLSSTSFRQQSWRRHSTLKTCPSHNWNMSYSHAACVSSKFLAPCLKARCFLWVAQRLSPSKL